MVSSSGVRDDVAADVVPAAAEQPARAAVSRTPHASSAWPRRLILVMVGPFGHRSAVTRALPGRDGIGSCESERGPAAVPGSSRSGANLPPPFRAALLPRQRVEGR